MFSNSIKNYNIQLRKWLTLSKVWAYEHVNKKHDYLRVNAVLNTISWILSMELIGLTKLINQPCSLKRSLDQPGNPHR